MSPVKIDHSCKEINDKQKIWRFMSIEKLLYLVQEKSLYFCQLKIIAEKFDKHEGKISRMALSYIKTYDDLVSHVDQNKEITIFPSPIKRMNQDDFKRMAEEELKYLYVNCWHINDIEYQFMWDTYAKRNLGVAIQTTFRKLCDCLESCDENTTILKVNYDVRPDPSALISPLMYKREHFSPEKELRLKICGLEEKPGYSLTVNLESLIENIYLKPRTTKHHRNIIQKILTNYKLNKRVLSSTIDIDPVY